MGWEHWGCVQCCVVFVVVVVVVAVAQVQPASSSIGRLRPTRPKKIEMQWNGGKEKGGDCGACCFFNDVVGWLSEDVAARDDVCEIR